MNGLIFLIVFSMGFCAGLLVALWDDSPEIEEQELRRRMDKWDNR